MYSLDGALHDHSLVSQSEHIVHLSTDVEVFAGVLDHSREW
ncbi:hypothetical protein ACG7TL_003367 [Trametes sanguinea]